jgi:hypothetical protein
MKRLQLCLMFCVTRNIYDRIYIKEIKESMVPPLASNESSSSFAVVLAVSDGFSMTASSDFLEGEAGAERTLTSSLTALSLFGGAVPVVALLSLFSSFREDSIISLSFSFNDSERNESVTKFLKINLEESFNASPLS